MPPKKTWFAQYEKQQSKKSALQLVMSPPKTNLMPHAAYINAQNALTQTVNAEKQKTQISPSTCAHNDMVGPTQPDERGLRRCHFKEEQHCNSSSPPKKTISCPMRRALKSKMHYNTNSKCSENNANLSQHLRAQRHGPDAARRACPTAVSFQIPERRQKIQEAPGFANIILPHQRRFGRNHSLEKIQSVSMAPSPENTLASTM